MRARDEEIRFLKMQLTEEQRTLSLMKRALPTKKTMEQEIVSLQIEASIMLVRENPDVSNMKSMLLAVLACIVRQLLTSWCAPRSCEGHTQY